MPELLKPDSKLASAKHGKTVSTMQRIAYLVSEYPALSHTFITNEIAELEARGHHVLPVSVRRPKNKKATEGELADEAARTFFLLPAVPRIFIPAFFQIAVRNPIGVAKMAAKAFHIFRKNFRPVTSFAYFAEAVVLIRAMRQQGIRHVHNHFGNAAANVALIASASGEVDYSLSIHGPDIFYNVEADSLAEKVEGATFTRCISHFCKSQLCLITKPKYWNRFHIVRCGVDTKQFHPNDRTNADNEIPHLLCVGRLVPAKGQHILLEAAAQIQKRGLDFKLTFVGTGPDEAHLRAFAKELEMDDAIEFTGGLPPAEVREYFQQADLFILPSFAEGVPVVLMEAMSFGIPVISTPIAGIPELIEHNHSGVLTPPGCITSLANAIGDFLVEPDTWKPLAAEGRETVRKHYKKSANGADMAQLVESQLSL